ncbi:hypothetical protein [Propionibacterium sp. oral taxon 192]|nr:hypothetical protein [Propionibacterium sp. oral taxon 192]
MNIIGSGPNPNAFGIKAATIQDASYRKQPLPADNPHAGPGE